ncbi:hypothetical protein ACTQ7B_000836 [Vibrio alginolyticus]
MKYQTEMDAIPNCPPNAKEQVQMTAYRLVKDPVDADGFLPPGILNPSRVDSADVETKCSFYALSFFTTEAKAEKHYNKLKGKVPNLEKTIGKNIAEGSLVGIDGFATKPSTRSGHFDFYERASCNLAPKFQITKRL